MLIAVVALVGLLVKRLQCYPANMSEFFISLSPQDKYAISLSLLFGSMQSFDILGCDLTSRKSDPIFFRVEIDYYGYTNLILERKTDAEQPEQLNWLNTNCTLFNKLNRATLNVSLQFVFDVSHFHSPNIIIDQKRILQEGQTVRLEGLNEPLMANDMQVSYKLQPAGLPQDLLSVTISEKRTPLKLGLLSKYERAFITKCIVTKDIILLDTTLINRFEANLVRQIKIYSLSQTQANNLSASQKPQQERGGLNFRFKKSSVVEFIRVDQDNVLVYHASNRSNTTEFWQLNDKNLDNSQSFTIGLPLMGCKLKSSSNYLDKLIVVMCATLDMKALYRFTVLLDPLVLLPSPVGLDGLVFDEARYKTRSYQFRIRLEDFHIKHFFFQIDDLAHPSIFTTLVVGGSNVPDNVVVLMKSEIAPHTLIGLNRLDSRMFEIVNSIPLYYQDGLGLVSSNTTHEHQIRYFREAEVGLRYLHHECFFEHKTCVLHKVDALNRSIVTVHIVDSSQRVPYRVFFNETVDEQYQHIPMTCALLNDSAIRVYLVRKSLVGQAAEEPSATLQFAHFDIMLDYPTISYRLNRQDERWISPSRNAKLILHLNERSYGQVLLQYSQQSDLQVYPKFSAVSVDQLEYPIDWLFDIQGPISSLSLHEDTDESIRFSSTIKFDRQMSFHKTLRCDRITRLQDGCFLCYFFPHNFVHFDLSTGDVFEFSLLSIDKGTYFRELVFKPSEVEAAKIGGTLFILFINFDGDLALNSPCITGLRAVPSNRSLAKLENIVYFNKNKKHQREKTKFVYSSEHQNALYFIPAEDQILLVAFHLDENTTGLFEDQRKRNSFLEINSNPSFENLNFVITNWDHVFFGPYLVLAIIGSREKASMVCLKFIAHSDTPYLGSHEYYVVTGEEVILNFQAIDLYFFKQPIEDPATTKRICDPLIDSTTIVAIKLVKVITTYLFRYQHLCLYRVFEERVNVELRIPSANPNSRELKAENQEEVITGCGVRDYLLVLKRSTDSMRLATVYVLATNHSYIQQTQTIQYDSNFTFGCYFDPLQSKDCFYLFDRKDNLLNLYCLQQARIVFTNLTAFDRTDLVVRFYSPNLTRTIGLVLYGQRPQDRGSIKYWSGQWQSMLTAHGTAFWVTVLIAALVLIVGYLLLCSRVCRKLTKIAIPERMLTSHTETLPRVRINKSALLDT